MKLWNTRKRELMKREGSFERKENVGLVMGG
jgi:hypothetical protein